MSIQGNTRKCSMGMGVLADPKTIIKRKFRWMFRLLSNKWIGTAVNALPPLKGARPSVEFKDIEVQHVTEDVFLPGKPAWKPINIVLYDLCPPSNSHPIWSWILNCYDPTNAGGSNFFAILDKNFKQDCVLEMYDGCGGLVEMWYFENAYPSQVNFGDLDMGDSGVVTCDITLRYDRAGLVNLNSI